VLASVGPPIPSQVFDLLVEVARDLRAGVEDAPMPVVHVLSIARIWGTALGLPNPGLYPNRIEIEEQRRIVDTAAATAARLGFEVKSSVLSARNPAKVIMRYAETIGAKAIVVGDPSHSAKAWERAIKGDPVNEMIRRGPIAVHAIPIDEPSPRGMWARSRGAAGGADTS
jgi:nucleotide-binding universal stress UspA family protein